MPSASPELRDRIEERFGSIDTWGPENYLRARGFIFVGGRFFHPDREKFTQEEMDCLEFLVHEWDYSYEPKSPVEFSPDESSETSVDPGSVQNEGSDAATQDQSD